MNAKIFMGLFFMVVFALSVSANLNMVPNSGTLTFDDLNVAESTSFTLENNGSSTLGGFDFTVTGFSGLITKTNFDLTLPATMNGSTTSSVTMTVDLSSLDLDMGDYNGTITVMDNNTAVADPVYDLKIVVPQQNMLVFDNLEWDVEFPRSEDPSDDDDDLYDGDNIEIGEGSKVVISGDVKNLFDEDIKIEDIEVNLEIENMDGDGDDYEEDENIKDLKDGKDDSFSFEFYVPYDEFDDKDTASAILWVEGEDENNVMHYDEIRFTFRIEKDNEEVTIMDAYLDDDEVSCGESTTLWVKLKNTGEDDLSEDDRNTATLTIENKKLGIGEIIRDIEMESDEDDDSNEQLFSFNLDLSDAEPSSTRYSIKIKAYSDEDEESDIAAVLLLVGECETTTTQAPVTTTQAPVTTTLTLPEGQGQGQNYATFPTVVNTKKGISASTWYIVLLIIVIVILIILAIIMLGYVMRK